MEDETPESGHEAERAGRGEHHPSVGVQQTSDHPPGRTADSDTRGTQPAGKVTCPTLLVPVRVPLEAGGEATVRKAIDFASELGGAHLFFLHVNLQYRNQTVTRRQLKHHIENTVGRLVDASYHARDTFFLEEAILDEAILQEVDYVVIGHSRRKRWRRWLERRLGTSIDLESILEQQLNADLVVM